jgi:uroporphyrinogen III methyltransferase / synthase
MRKKNKGRVYLVGAGPGDPELLTLKGKRLLGQADAVVYDRLVNPRILEHIPAGVKSIYVGKASSRHTLSQDKINMLLVKLAESGKTVVRLKGGDPFVFGRGGEEVLTLVSRKIPFEVVPGITSAIAVPAYAGIPVTQRGLTSSLGIFTGQEDPEKEDSNIDWEKISTGMGTLVFLMGFENLEKITQTLIKFGRKPNTPCCLIQWGTLPGQRSLVAKLDDIFVRAEKEKFSAPAILVVGEVVSLKNKIDWFEKRPLFGKKILVTVPSDDSARLSVMLEEQGGQCLDFPLIAIEPLEDYQDLDEAIKHIDGFDWLVFTSRNGVKFFKSRLDQLKKDVRILKGIKLACIGPKTEEALKDYLGIGVDIRPKEFRQEGLLQAFKKTGIKDKKILIVRAREARDVLPEGLRKMGAAARVIAAYQTVPARRDPGMDKALKEVDLVTFTSSSCVEGFFRAFSTKAVRAVKHEFIVCSIGPVTSATCRKFGLKVDIEAKDYTLEGLAMAITGYFRKGK